MKRRTNHRFMPRRATGFERLEDRAMLSGNGTALAESSILTAGATSGWILSVAGNDQPVILSMHVEAAGAGTLDPAAPQLEELSGSLIPPISSLNDQAGGTDGVLVVQVAPGTYNLEITGEGGTTGDFVVHVGVAGDIGQSGQVSGQDYAIATAALVQTHFGMNHVAAQLFDQLGIDTTTNLYAPELDPNVNGVVDPFDHGVIGANRNTSAVEIELIGDDNPPEIQAALAGDSGRSSLDGITNDLGATIAGTITEEVLVVSFTASIDGSAAVELPELLGQDLSYGGTFELNLGQLETIADNVSLVDSGPHVLTLDAEDFHGNTSAVPLELTFEFDTIAPDAPINLNMDSASDSGKSDADDITNLDVVTIRVEAEDDAEVELFSTLAGDVIGQGVASSPLDITTDPLPEGQQDITATATDVAGNTGAASDPLSIEVDMTLSAAPAFDLDAASDSGDPGDQLTNIATVTFTGTTEPDADVELRLAESVVATETANGSGAFTLSGVVLPFGASTFQAVATDVAGNFGEFSRTITRNNAPVIGDQSLSVAENSPDGTVVGTVAATDADDSEGDTLSFLISGGNTSGAFSINVTSGEISVANTDAIDFETSTAFTLTVDVTDAGGDGSGVPGTGLTSSATITVNVDDTNDPPEIGNQSFGVPENSADETSVGTVVAGDPDGDNLTFEIIAGNFSGAFAIDSGNGEITVADGDMLNFEGSPTFALTVAVTDPATLTDSAEVTVNVGDVNEPPVVQDQTFGISLNSPDGFLVGTIAVGDPDAGDTFTFQVTASDAPADLLSVHGTTGDINIVDADAVVPGATLTLAVLVTDQGGTGLSDTATLTVNVVANVAPEAEDDLSSTNEDTAVDIDVLADNGNGRDSDTDGLFSDLTVFSFDTTSTMGATITEGSLLYDPSGSTVLNALGVGASVVDTFNYVVADKYGATDTATVFVTVTGINDDPVAVNDEVQTDEDTAINVDPLVENVNGPDSDPDTGDSLNVVSVDGTSAQGATLTLNPDGTVTYDPTTTAALQSLNSVDSPVVDTFGYTINDDNSGAATATVSVTVSGVDDVSPVAVGDVFQVVVDSADHVLAVLANDSVGPDSLAGLVISAIGTTSGGGVAVTSNGATTITYTPASGFLGEDHFSYTVDDGIGGTDQTMVTVQVTQDVPDLSGHIHAGVEIYINGVLQPNAPENVGVSDLGPPIEFLSAVHMHDEPGRWHIHTIEGGEPTQPVTLGDVFDTWRLLGGLGGNNPDAILNNGQVLDHVLAGDEVVRLYVNDVPVDKLGDYVIRDEDQIKISVEKIGVANAVSLVPVPDPTIRAGAPLHLPLVGFDPDRSDLTFTAVSSAPGVVETFILENNRSMWMDVQGFGQMAFELFESRVPEFTNHVIELAQSGILDNTILHRIIDAFVFQGFDPTGTGYGHPGVLKVDDAYHADLMHTSSGLLSAAKAADDGNGSQGFNTDINPDVNPSSESMLRRLDYNHTVYGRQTLGENIRRLIMLVDTDGSDRPIEDVLVTDVEIQQNNQAAVLMLSAPAGTTGTSDVTVTVEDSDGNEFSQTFTVTVIADEFNSVPFFTSFPENVQTTIDTPVDLPLGVFDREGDPTLLVAATTSLETTILFDNAGGETGVTPVGTTSFSYNGSNWSGGTVAAPVDDSLGSSGSFSYEIDSNGGEVTFDVPATSVQFFYVHGFGIPAGTATAFDVVGNVVDTADSSAATEFNDPDHFATLSGGDITRVTFSSGVVDNFYFRADTVNLVFSVDNDNGIVTVTPPAGFTGMMAILVGVQQDPSVSVDTVDIYDRQTIPITVSAPLMAAEGQAGSSDGGSVIPGVSTGDGQIVTALDTAVAIWADLLPAMDPLEIRLDVRDLPFGQLGSAHIDAVNDLGLPLGALVTVDDDAAGHGWHMSWNEAVNPDRYDLVTVLLHEVGHVLGLGHDEMHQEDRDGASGLMHSELQLGQRRLPSELDALILRAAYARDDDHGLSGIVGSWERAAVDSIFAM